jgi:hypothetical protein
MVARTTLLVSETDAIIGRDACLLCARATLESGMFMSEVRMHRLIGDIVWSVYSTTSMLEKMMAALTSNWSVSCARVH